MVGPETKVDGVDSKEIPREGFRIHDSRFRGFRFKVWDFTLEGSKLTD